MISPVGAGASRFGLLSRVGALGVRDSHTFLENFLKVFSGRVDWAGLPFDVSTRARWARTFTTARRRQTTVTLHADHAVHPRGRGSDARGQHRLQRGHRVD